MSAIQIETNEFAASHLADSAALRPTAKDDDAIQNILKQRQQRSLTGIDV